MVSLQSFEHFMASFLWSITECRPWKIVVDFFLQKHFFLVAREVSRKLILIQSENLHFSKGDNP